MTSETNSCLETADQCINIPLVSVDECESYENYVQVTKTFLSNRFMLYLQTIPVFLEVAALIAVFFVGHSIAYRSERIKHSALFGAEPHRVGFDREKPLEHNAKKFFQNQHGLWIHYCVWQDPSLELKPKKETTGSNEETLSQASSHSESTQSIQSAQSVQQKSRSPVRKQSRNNVNRQSDHHEEDTAEGQQVKGLIIFLHGHSEHINRHEHTAEYFASQGYIVFGIDHQGFGRSEGDRGHVESFQHYIDDIELFFTDVLERNHPHLIHLPKFLMSHSMGGLIAIRTALHFQGIISTASIEAQRCRNIGYLEPNETENQCVIESENKERAERMKELYSLAGVVVGSPALYLSPKTRNKFIVFWLRILAFLFPKLQVFSFPSAPSTSFLQTKFHAQFDPLNYNERLRPHQLLEMIDAAAETLQTASTFRTPILLFHGDKDKTSDIQGSRLFFERIETQEEDRTLLELEGLLHEPMQEPWEVRKPLLQQISKWLSQRGAKDDE